MAENKNKYHGRIGIIKNRKQFYNPKTKKYAKIDAKTGKILSTSDKKYKDIILIK